MYNKKCIIKKLIRIFLFRARVNISHSIQLKTLYAIYDEYRY